MASTNQTDITYANHWRRNGAFLIDILPFWLALKYASLSIFKPMMVSEENNLNGFIQPLVNEAAPAIYATYGILLLWALYMVLSHLLTGQTLGKKLLGIQVIRTKNRHNNFFNIIIRELPFIGLLTSSSCMALLTFEKFLTEHNLTTNAPIWTMSSPFIVLTALLLGIWIIVSIITALVTGKRNRTLHDIMAGTVVVRAIVSEATPNTQVQD